MIALDQDSAKEAQLKLAAIAATMQRGEEAKELYQRLENDSRLEVAYRARLEMARLDFSQSPEKNLKKLHDLGVKKNLATEPIHFEAALDFAELKASTYPEQERAAALLELFYQIKTNYTEQVDICSKDYHASRLLFPEKDLIYQAYMRYLDARIYLLQAHVSPGIDSKNKTHAAWALFTTLRQGNTLFQNIYKRGQ